MFVDQNHCPSPLEASRPAPEHRLLPGYDSPLAALGLDQLERDIGELAAHIAAATCRWLMLIAEFDRRKGHEASGFTSCATWLAWRCSIAPRAAHEHLRVARSLLSLPRIKAAFASGSLSYSKVRALTRVAEPEMEAELLVLAQEATAAQLERLMRGYRGALAEDGDRAIERRHLTTHWDDDGSLRISGSFPAEEGALLLKALELAQGQLAADVRADTRVDGEGAKPRPTAADAMIAVAESAIARGVTAASGGDRHQVVVHVDLDGLASSDRDDRLGGRLDCGVGLPAATLSRLSCDASVVALVERDGKPLSVGRKTRSIPPSVARALRARDGGCRFPGCDRDRFVDAHHVEHWAHGGETSLENLVQLCRHHHRLVHEGGFSIESRRGDLVFRRPDGSPVPACPPASSGSVAGCVPEDGGAAIAQTTVDPDTCRPRSNGSRMDADLAVFALAAMHERRGHRSEVPVLASGTATATSARAP